MRIAMRNVNKWFGANHVVNHVNLEAEEGEFVILLGPSGCGKTTILRLIAGLEQCDEGQIIIGERDVTALPPKFRDLAMVFQSYALYPHKTVADNIAFPLALRRVPAGERRQAAHEAAAQVKIADLLERYPRQLSGGQRQRVALARAIVRRPAAFLMDEPLSNLDARLRSHMRAELKNIQKRLGITTVYVTHDQIEAMTLGDRVVVLNQGEVSQVGPPGEIYGNPRTLFVADFVGSPPMNQVRGRVRQGVFYAGDSKVAVDAADCEHAVLGVRTEDVAPAAAADGDFAGVIYASELLGDCTLVTCQTGDTLLALKTDKNFAGGIGEPFGVRLNRDRLFLFDANHGRRIDNNARRAGKP
ncbi:MAG: ABC transporter ATP-binding protein [Gammaproteobacteria bacterium]|nr:ABC transporter ATP-binding protein [Gammaproteobacteria bacterium]MDD9800135.1 ABC transporter ATP-binding protein [Gammaproteobacteria bacterium]MDD9815310.1 ABC transporter ATP-binding protein [Gammaproteobacteria bacterium]MDD9850795.1 ABC transporter ATP-binding protein [Gammaproteobacteria bacterium]MDD9871000.1 ABC transporter ATP-binding protein [Gammaproteobacteria bacterium]